MLKHRKYVPLDYSLCRMTVTVYRHRDASRHVVKNVHYEFTDLREILQGKARRSRSFLLVIPGLWEIQPGDKVVLGEGPEGLNWEQLNGSVATLGVVRSVKPRYFNGRICHMEARG